LKQVDLRLDSLETLPFVLKSILRASLFGGGLARGTLTTGASETTVFRRIPLRISVFGLLLPGRLSSTLAVPFDSARGFSPGEVREFYILSASGRLAPRKAD